MDLFGLTVARTKALDVRIKALTRAALSSVSGSRGWWPLIREMTTGAWQRNQDVPLDTALSNPTLYACVTLIMRDVGKCRPRVVEFDDDGIKTEIQSPAFSPVLRRPNHYQNRIEFFSWWIQSKLVYGNTYALKQRDGRNVVTALYLLDPNRVQPLVAPDGSVFYRLGADELNLLRAEVIVPAREMIHDREEPLFHPLVGVSPIYAAGWPAIAGLNIRRAQDTFFTNGSKPSGILTAPGDIDDATAERIVDYWNTHFTGDNAGNVAFLSGGVTYQPATVTAESSQLVEQLRMTDEDICRAFHMPRHKVGVGPDPSYDNIEALNQQYYTDCLQRHFEGLELCLTEGQDMPPSFGVDFDLTDLLRMDSQRRMETASTGVQSSIFSPNEARRLFDLPPVDGGESPLSQQQYFGLDTLADMRAREALNPAPPPTPPEPELANDEPADAAAKAMTALEYTTIIDSFRKQLDNIAV